MVKPKKNQKKIYINWTEITNLVYLLSKRINKGIHGCKNIYGVPRGGYIIAVLLSHRTDLPVVEWQDINNKTLIVDDINDSGETLERLEAIYYHKFGHIPTYATLYTREGTKISSNYSGKIIKNKDWLVFPWEVK